MRRPPFLFFFVIILAILALVWFATLGETASAQEPLRFGRTLVVSRVRLSQELQALMHSRIGAELRSRGLGELIDVSLSRTLSHASLMEVASLQRIDTVLEITGAKVASGRGLSVTIGDVTVTEEVAHAFLIARLLHPQDLVEFAGGEAFGEAKGYTGSISSRRAGAATVSLTTRERLQREALAKAIAVWFDGLTASLH